MKRIMAGIVSAAVILAPVAGTAVSAEDRRTPSGIAYGDIGREIDGFIERYEAGLASCEVSVFDGSGALYNGYYGFSDEEKGIPADETTVYEWGSCTKMLTWASVMQLYERGLIDLEADIRGYLPEGFLTKLRYEDEKITMINLMCHNAGFQESWYENQLCGEDGLFDSLEEAVRYCECYQAYRPGEYTAYSNWGTALAGYIVEQVSGQDYVTYVHENIFEPLGMEHTSIDPHMSDNGYVKSKRGELKCCYRGADPKYNEDYGECMTYVQLFPAGAAIGTLGDFAKFGSALLAEECPLFEKSSTKDLMLTPTSFYGDSDIAKNCHGLWTNEYGVQTVGHAGNTAGCSSMLQLYPEGGIGIVIMTNEPGETMFNYGMPEVIFGSVFDRKEFISAAADDTDISGFYRGARGISEGFGQAVPGGLPLERAKNGSYAVSMLGISLEAGSEIVPLAENIYIWKNNGMNMFLYRSADSKGRMSLESMSTDFIRDSRYAAETAVIFLTFAFSAVCLIMLAAGLIGRAVRRTKGRDIKHDTRITAQQVMFIVTAVIIAGSIGVVPGINTRVTTIAAALIVSAAAVISLANGCGLCYKGTSKNLLKSKWKGGIIKV